jgi:hypothetical protein
MSRPALKPAGDGIVLVIKPAPKPARFLGYVGAEVIVRSRQPFLDGARALLARGYDPATPYNMRHANSATTSFVTTTIERAARLSVADADRTRFQKHLPFEGLLKEAANDRQANPTPPEGMRRQAERVCRRSVGTGSG